MKQLISFDELKKIQIEILDEVNSYCEKNQLSYFLSSGTLIGAIRHKGYIPWDDDIDLYMPRDSYELFLSNYNNMTDGKYRVNEVRLDTGFSQPFIKVEDTTTVLVDPKTDYGGLGVSIDVFPLDYVPDNELLLSIEFKVKNLLYSISTAKSTPLGSIPLFPSRRWRAFVRLAHLIPISPVWINKLIIKIVKRTKPSCRVCNIAGNGPLSKRGCFNAQSIASSIPIEFEGKKYKTMEGFHDYLTHTYGNYMELPPVEKRKPSHQCVAYRK